MDLNVFEGTGWTEPYEVVRTVGFQLLGESKNGEIVTVSARLDVIQRVASSNYEAMVFTTNGLFPAMVHAPIDPPITADTPAGVINAFLERRRRIVSTIESRGNQQNPKPPEER